MKILAHVLKPEVVFGFNHFRQEMIYEQLEIAIVSAVIF